jgi:hypothetical protein
LKPVEISLSTCPYSLQIDFFAKDELVTIVPNFSLPTEDSNCSCMMVGIRVLEGAFSVILMPSQKPNLILLLN